MSVDNLNFPSKPVVEPVLGFCLIYTDAPINASPVVASTIIPFIFLADNIFNNSICISNSIIFFMNNKFVFRVQNYTRCITKMFHSC